MGYTDIKVLSDCGLVSVLKMGSHFCIGIVVLVAGPALYVYNNAVFTTEDWNGIQEIARSRKREDPLKVGRFGIGFNSVYHITGELYSSVIFLACVFFSLFMHHIFVFFCLTGFFQMFPVYSVETRLAC